MKVTLDIPDHINFQYVYRMERRSRYEVSQSPDWTFVFLNGLSQALSTCSLLCREFGRFGALRALAKIATPRRSLYLIAGGNKVLSYGWCNIGLCKYYKVEPDSVVIGPIWSDPAVRGRGLASEALKAAVNQFIGSGHSIFYIDTAKMNVPAQKVFQKCEFGEPVALYFR